MMPTLYNGISGVRTHSFGIDVVGNNISNVNTIGYKAARAEFNDIFYQALSASHKSTLSQEGGVGAFGASSALQMHEGYLQRSDRVLDVALDGKGFLGVRGVDGQTYYTRNGQLGIDSNHNLVDSNGNFILGMQNPGYASIGLPKSLMQMTQTNVGSVFGDEMDLELNDPSMMSPLKIPSDAVYLARPTSFVNIAGYLPVATEYASTNIDIDAASVNMEQINNEGKISTMLSGQLEQNDELLAPKKGDRVILTLKRENEKPFLIEALVGDDLRYNVEVRGQVQVLEALVQTKQEQEMSKEFATDIIDANGNKAKLSVMISRVLPSGGKLEYSANARIIDLDQNVTASAQGLLSFDEIGGLKSTTLDSVGGIKIGFGNAKDAHQNASNSLVAMDNVKIANSFEKDGVSAGVFSGMDIDERGNIMINYTNGKSQSAGKLAVFNFINEQGLHKLGENIYSASANSGEAYFISQEKGLSTAIRSKYLEGSNVDLGTELTQMIIFQKAYEANAKSISTADAMLKRAIDMKK